MEEIWKDIQGYEGLYQVSNFGRVKSLPKLCGHSTRPEKILKTGRDKSGYVSVTLCKSGKIKRFLIHRLVAIAFLPNPENKKEVNHLDCNTFNNNVSNLEWTTHSENMKHCVKMGKHQGTINLKKKKPIKAIKDDREIVFDSILQASKELDINNSAIVNVLKGRNKSAKGYKFEYINN